MTEMERYLAEEIAVDHADGIISRREALRRLGLMGLGAAAASSMLASFPPTAAAGAAASTGPAPSRHAGQPDPVPTEAITFAGPDGRTLMGAWGAAPGEARGGVLVIHENRGLTDHIRSVAGRLAASGYSALGIDLLSEEGGTGSFADPAEATAALNRVPPERLLADLKAGLSELERQLPGERLGVIGFCFGGAMTWRLLVSGEPRLAAAAPFYGPFPEGGDLAGSADAAVLGVYAELDARVNASRDAARAALQAAGARHEIVTFPGVDHAFFNDTGARYNPAAAAAAYDRVLEWFGRWLDR